MQFDDPGLKCVKVSFSLLLSHCLYGDRKGVWPVEISYQQPPNVLWKTCDGSDLTWRSVWIKVSHTEAESSGSCSRSGLECVKCAVP